MKKTIKYLSIFLLGLGLFAISSCETTNLDLTDNPNSLPTTAANADLLLNNVQVDFATAMQTFGATSAEVSRLSYMFGRNYQNNYGATEFNAAWRISYTGVLNNIKVMNTIAVQKDLKKHIGMGQVMEAYTIVTLVDMFGDIPYSEALDPTNLNPKLDAGADVYAKAVELLDDAIVNFNAASTVTPALDFYYNKNWAKWTKVANSIKLKIYLQTRLVDPTAIAKFNTIVASGNYIGSGEDFEFNWGVSNTNPDSRHPLFIDNYAPAGVEAGYASNWLMDVMKNSKTIQDPRMRYYFYRQVSNVPVSEQDIRCSVEPIPDHYAAGGYSYCIIDNSQGYWGRDHGNNEGIPNDRQKRTAAGVYPAGGKFDSDNFTAITGAAALSLGAKGNGITPILLSSSIDFMRAEAALFGGTGTAKIHMLAGIQKSFTKVRSFASRDVTANSAFIPAMSQDTQYMIEAGNSLDAAGTEIGRLNVIISEFMVSLYGNGTDAYNAYRRTGAPTSMQPNLEPNPGGFIRSFLYPASEANTNANMQQRTTVTERVFWDNNPLTGFPIGN